MVPEAGMMLALAGVRPSVSRSPPRVSRLLGSLLFGIGRH